MVWHFISLPQAMAAEIQTLHAVHTKRVRGWGSVRVEVCIGKTVWRTSIFPAKEINTYILPIKAAVRTSENISADDEVVVRFNLASKLDTP